MPLSISYDIYDLAKVEATESGGTYWIKFDDVTVFMERPQMRELHDQLQAILLGAAPDKPQPAVNPDDIPF